MLKVEHQGHHASFLDLDIEIEDHVFVYKPFHKSDTFPFFIVPIPNLSSNIPSAIFYGSRFSEFFRIARCTIIINDFKPRASDLILRMIAQGGNRALLTNQLKKAFHCYPNLFEKFGKTHDEINTRIMKNT